jgi:hypothetical protein
LFVGEGALKPALGTCERLIYALCELSEPGVEDGSLGLGVGCQGVQAPPELLFRLQQPRLECSDGLGPLPVERGGNLRLAALEPLHACIAGLREPLGQDRLRLPRERLHRTVELT